MIKNKIIIIQNLKIERINLEQETLNGKQYLSDERLERGTDKQWSILGLIALSLSSNFIISNWESLEAIFLILEWIIKLIKHIIR
ncbi:MAG: hypothetical protein R2788_18235 [Saprospiraceae bacterium]